MVPPQRFDGLSFQPEDLEETEDPMRRVRRTIAFLQLADDYFVPLKKSAEQKRRDRENNGERGLPLVDQGTCDSSKNGSDAQRAAASELELKST